MTAETRSFAQRRRGAEKNETNRTNRIFAAGPMGTSGRQGNQVNFFFLCASAPLRETFLFRLGSAA